MKFFQLRYFQAACKYNGVSKAAEILHVSQPSISIAIGDLEKEFGVSLFCRTNKQFTLTQEGSFFLSKVNEILAQVDALSQQMNDMGSHKNIINFGLIPIAGSYLFPALFDEFRSKKPEVQIVIQEYGLQKAIRSVEDGDSDLAIILVESKKSEQLDGIVILNTEYLFCVDKSHPLANLKQIDLDRLATESLILFQKETYLTSEIKKRFYQQGLVPNVLLYAVHLPLIIELLASGKEGTFLTKEAAAQIPNIVAIPLTDPMPVSFALVWKKGKSIHGNLLKFVTLIKELYPNALPY
ncbi:MAG TPA: LysR family transcriptional regulator [Anaerovoracaceae bacterium]|nr:LysR family transcriptional regulator [Anaerovoracaceae bacterium]